MCSGTKNFDADYPILRSMSHKELTNRKTGRPFFAPLAHVRQFLANVIWIVTFWLQCHTYQHISMSIVAAYLLQ